MSFYSEKTVTARRDYVCHLCGRMVDKGVLHVSVTNNDGRSYVSTRAHVECHEFATNQPAPAPTAATHTLAASPT